ncbi:agmatine deiminase family protein [Ensifer sp.]|jgi:agmatine deiminase|uniref:agmatine deiminase family protein n=1 Tax=Ensifer sp. TaxID=1872086 RepID=UPI002E0D7067|nr:agmatine deiminase family protein [Ensifer sp.]
MMTSRRGLFGWTVAAAVLGRGGLISGPDDARAKTAKAGANCGTPATASDLPPLSMPAEWAPHRATWMAYGATPGAWGEEMETAFGRDLTNSRTVARQDLMRLAANLSRFEPVFMLANTADDEAEAKNFLAEIIAQTSPKDQIGTSLDNSGRIYIGKHRDPTDLPAIGTFPITFLQTPINDLWTRDTAPVFVRDDKGVLHGVDVNFNGWGQWPIRTGLCDWAKDPQKTENGVMDQPIDGDMKIATFINKQAETPGVATWLTMEGGGLEVNGSGLAVAMESCIINDNRNPGKSKADIEAELLRVFGVERVIWMPGVKGAELTDWHVDFTAKFVSQAQMVFAFDPNFEPKDRRNEKALQAAVAEINALPDDLKRKYLGGADATLTLHALPVPRIEKVYDTFKRRNGKLDITERTLDEFTETTAPGYVGFTHANGAIIQGQFGDQENDLIAFNTLQALYPEHFVVQISTDGLASGGGTIHCATQQQPA